MLFRSGEALRQGLTAAPDFVKPNRNEASGFANYPIDSIDKAAEATQKFFAAGAKSVAISLGAAGMIWQGAADGALFISQPAPLAKCSPVGCGDAALAGFAVAHERGLSDEETLRLATACGSANCLAEAPGRVDAREVSRLAREIRVRRIVPREFSRPATVEAQ